MISVYSSNKYDIFYIDFQHLGDSSKLIEDICSGCHPFAKKLETAKKPVIIVGGAQLSRPDGGAILAKVKSFANKISKDVSTVELEIIVHLIMIDDDLS